MDRIVKASDVPYAIVQRSVEYPDLYEVVVNDEVFTYTVTDVKGDDFLGKMLPLIANQLTSNMLVWRTVCDSATKN